MTQVSSVPADDFNLAIEDLYSYHKLLQERQYDRAERRLSNIGGLVYKPVEYIVNRYAEELLANPPIIHAMTPKDQNTLSSKRDFPSKFRTVNKYKELTKAGIDVEVIINRKGKVRNDATHDSAVPPLSRVIEVLNEAKKLILYFDHTARLDEIPRLHTNFNPHGLLSDSTEEGFLANIDDITDTSNRREILFEDLSRYSAHLPPEFRKAILEKILSNAWEGITHYPETARELLDPKFNCDPELKPIILPLAKMTAGQLLKARELEDFLISVRILSESDTGEMSRAAAVITTRILRYLLFYHQASLLEDKEILAQITSLSQRNDRFWGEFFSDLHFRHICGYIHLSPQLLACIEVASRKYLLDCPDTALAFLEPFISSPYQQYKKYSLEEFLDRVQKIAGICQSVVECKWTLSAFLRVNSLYTSPNEENEYKDLLNDLILYLPYKLWSNSSFLVFRYLHTFLKSFIHTKNTEYLKKYEAEYLKRHSKLLLPQKTHLQLEYASSLYVCCQLLGLTPLQQLRFGVLVKTAPGTLAENLLFANEWMIKSKYHHQPPTLTNLNSIFSWLNSYISDIFNNYAKPIIKGNHLQVFQFPVTRKVYQIRGEISQIVSRTLPELINSGYEYPISFYCRSIRLFSFVNRQQKIDLMKQYLEKALKAADYELMINAHDLFYALYACYYYDKRGDQSQIRKIADKLANITRIGKKTSQIKRIPRLYWGYYAGILYPQVKTERDFVDELWMIISTVSRKVYQLDWQRSYEVDLPISRIRDCIIKYDNKKSLLAATAPELMNEPEFWNLLATTAYNYYDQNGQNDPDELKKVTAFYAIAKYFARSRKDYDQKYCYNYIRCKALIYEAEKSKPEDFYICDVARYLRQRASQFFNFKEEVIKYYSEVVVNHWPEISPDSRATFCDLLQHSRTNWVRKTLPKGRSILDLC